MSIPALSGDFQKRVADQIVGVFGSLIPDDQLNAMIEAAIREFFESGADFKLTDIRTTGWNSTYSASTASAAAVINGVSPFKVLVWRYVHEKALAALTKSLEGQDSVLNELLAEWTKIPQFKEQTLSQAQQLALAMAGSMFQSLITGATMQTRQEIVSRLRNNQAYIDIANTIDHG